MQARLGIGNVRCVSPAGRKETQYRNTAARKSDLLADFAVILAITNGWNLNGKPMKVLQVALSLDTNHQKSLALRAAAAFNQRPYTAAIGYLERLRDAAFRCNICRHFSW